MDNYKIACIYIKLLANTTLFACQKDNSLFIQKADILNEKKQVK